MTATIEHHDLAITEKTTDGESGFTPRTEADVESIKKKKASKVARDAGPGVLSRLGAHLGGSIGTTTKAIGLRLITIFAAWVLVMLTAMTVLPLLGATLHQQSGAQGMNLEGMLAFWLVPFVFLAVMITVLEIAIIRRMWRAASRRITRWRENDTVVDEPVSPTAGGFNKKQNRKRRTK